MNTISTIDIPHNVDVFTDDQFNNIKKEVIFLLFYLIFFKHILELIFFALILIF